MNSSIVRPFSLLTYLLIPIGISHAQSLDVAGKIKGFYDETIVPAFPWAVLLVFFGVGIGNFSLFVGENADIKKGLYRMFLYPLIVMIFGIIVDFLKNYRI